MPLYHFNVFDGVSGRDEDGTELAHLPDARLEAVSLAGQIISEQAKRLQSGMDWHMELTDHKGRILLRLDFIMTLSAAAHATLPYVGRP